MLDSFLLFAPGVRLHTTENKSSPSFASRTVCTLTPERSSVSETRTSARKLRVLPDNLAKSERPPLPPHHRSIPVIGFFIEKALGILTSSAEKRERYGRIYTSNYFLNNRCYISDYQSIIDVLRDSDTFRSAGASDILELMFGEDSIVILDGETHTKSRAAFAPAFSPSLFPYYFKRASSRTLKTWERVFEMKERGENVRLEPIFREHYLAITVEMTTGVDMEGSEASRILELFETMQFGFISPLFGPVWNTALRARDEILKILGGVVRKNLTERADTIEKLREYGDAVVKMGLKDIGRGEVDMLLVTIANSSLPTGENAFVDEQVVESLCRSMMLLWFAGYATAAMTSMCASFEMGLDEAIRTQLIAEQDDIVSGTSDKDTTVTYEQVTSQMPLLDSFLMEMLRLHPAAVGVTRKISRNVEILGRFVPKGMVVFCDFMTAMRDAELYADPNSIVADRFVKSDTTKPPPAILSFGVPGSPHYCIGAAFAKVMMKLTFAALLREYSYTLQRGQSRAYKMIPESTPKSGIVVDCFEKRA